MASAIAGTAALDAATLRLCRDLAGRLFPWDINRALELALLKTFCLPSVAALLHRTGEFEQRPRKRYDDTALMVAELLRLGPDSPDGRAVIQRLNRIHGSYRISPADYASVLSGFVAEPIAWLERFGWRALDRHEQQALFRFWDHVGALMGISERPKNLNDLLALNREVELQRFQSASGNRLVADATLRMLLEPWPAPLRPLLSGALRALLAPEVLASLTWKPAPGWLTALVQAGLRGRSRLLNLQQRLWTRRGQRFYSERPTASYGAQFELEQLGPPALLARLNSPRWSGPQRRIGLTGGIASGKSTVARWLEQQGFPVLDADMYAREVLAPGSAGAQAVLERYGAAVRARGTEPGAHVLDRGALGQIVFNAREEREWLEQLVHPLVRQRFNAELIALVDQPTVVLVIPLLFEAGLEGLCSEVWLVDCEPAQQLQRLMQRDGLSEASAQARINAQWPLERKRLLADQLINNRSDASAVAKQLEPLLSPEAEARARASQPPALITPAERINPSASD